MRSWVSNAGDSVKFDDFKTASLLTSSRALVAYDSCVIRSPMQRPALFRRSMTDSSSLVISGSCCCRVWPITESNTSRIPAMNQS